MTAAGSYMTLTGQLRRGRMLRHLSQERAAGLAGVSRRTFQRWEDGTLLPDAIRLFRWAEAVGVRIASDLTHFQEARP